MKTNLYKELVSDLISHGQLEADKTSNSALATGSPPPGPIKGRTADGKHETTSLSACPRCGSTNQIGYDRS
jgi:hypothetical protein